MGPGCAPEFPAHHNRRSGGSVAGIADRLQKYNQARSILSGLTPELVSYMVRSAYASSDAQCRLFETMISRDTEISGAISQRELALQSGQWDIVPDESAGKRASKRLLEILKKVRGWKRAIGRLGRAPLFGFSVVEIVFSDSEPGVPVALRPLPYAALNYQEGELRIAVDGKWLRVRDYPDIANRLIITTADDNDPPSAAILRTVAVLWLAKMFAIEDWAVYLEKLAIPPAILKYKRNEVQVPEGDARTVEDFLMDKLRAMRADANITMPIEWELELLADDRADASRAFNLFMEYVDRRIKRAILTSESTMQSGVEGQGSRAADEVRAEYGLDTIIQADGEMICEALQEQLVDRVSEMLGYGTGIARVQVNWRKELSTAKQVEAMCALKGAGFFFDEDKELVRVGFTPKAPTRTQVNIAVGGGGGNRDNGDGDGDSQSAVESPVPVLSTVEAT